jgi:hypothetical protein
VFGAIALIMIESWPRLWFVQKSAAAADPMALSDAYPFLASEPDRGGVVELPVADRSGWRTLYLTRYTYASAAHQRRIVAIHGGVRPAVTDSLLNAAVYAPDSTAMRLLSSHGVTRLVIHLPLMTGGKGPWMVKRLQLVPRGDKSRYTDKEKRQADHIEEGYEERGLSEEESKRRAWATVNKVHHGGEKPGGGGYGKPEDHSPMRKGGRKGGSRER